MLKWAGIFLLIMIAAAVVGLFVEAIRFITGALFVICLVGFVATGGLKILGRRDAG